MNAIMRFPFTRITVILMFFTLAVTAQNGDYRFISLSAGFNWIGYSDSSNGQDFNYTEFTNPFYFEVEGRLSEHFGISLNATTNEVSIAGDPPGRSYFSTDLLSKWYLDNYIWDNNDIEWDVKGGIGWYNHDGGSLKPVATVGTGVRWWIFDQWGVSASAVRKFNIATDAPLNDHFQYTAGIVFGIKKKQKAANTEEQKSELETMSEAQDNPQAEPTQVNPEQATMTSTEVTAAQPIMIESVYFDRNSSFIGESETNKLDELVRLMQEDPGRRVFINTFTDDTGQMEYNQWLAGKRLERTAGYLVENGISPNRIQGEARGVDPASRDCTNCTEAEERIFRRAEFRLYQ